MFATLWLGAALAATMDEPAHTFQAVVTEPNQACVAKDFGGHHCPTTCSGMTDISSASITTSAQCIAACCADPKIKVCTYAGFEDATKTCVAGDWTPCPSCRKLNGWTTTLINFGPPSPSPSPPSPPSPPPPPPPPPSPPSPGPSPPPSPGGSTTSTFTLVDAFGATLNGAQIEGQDPIYLRSGTVPQDAPVSATLKLSLTPGTTITGVSFAYQYVTGYKGTVGANFTLDVAGTAAYSSPTVNNYPFSKSGGIGAYSPAVNVASKGLRIAVPSSGGGVAFNFHNIDRNLQLALPMTINITCTGSSACFSGPAKPPRSTVWHVVWVGGQSNSVGTNSQTSGYPTWPGNPLIQMMCSHGATPTFDTASYPVCGENNVGFSLTFANLLLPTLPKGHGVVLLNTGVGGTGFSDGRWVVPNGPLTVNSINKVNQLAAALPTLLGGTYNFHAMLWHQGEEDAGDNHQHYHATYCQYLQSDLGALIDHFRTNFKGATLGTPFMDGGMLPYWVDAVNGTDGVMSAIYALNTSRPCTGTADSRIFPDYFPGTKTPAGEPGHRSGVTGDVIHFNATQATLMGYQYFEAYKRAVSLDTVVPSAKTKACGSSTVAKTQCTGGPVVF